MAVPKNRISQSRSRRRRTANMKIKNVPNPIECPNCGDMKLSHRVCLKCGFYKGKEVYKVGKIKEEE